MIKQNRKNYETKNADVQELLSVLQSYKVKESIEEFEALLTQTLDRLKCWDRTVALDGILYMLTDDEVKVVEKFFRG